MNTLQAGHLVLEPLVAAHAAAMYAVLSDPAIYEFENAPPESVEWLERRYRRLESRASADGSQHWLNWVVRLPDGQLAGTVQATVVPGSHALVAYELASAHWRQGIGRLAVGRVLDELAAAYAVRRVAAVLKARNFRSAALLRSLGFSLQPLPGMAPLRHDPDEIVMVRAVDGPRPLTEPAPGRPDEAGPAR